MVVCWWLRFWLAYLSCSCPNCFTAVLPQCPLPPAWSLLECWFKYQQSIAYWDSYGIIFLPAFCPCGTPLTFGWFICLEHSSPRIKSFPCSTLSPQRCWHSSETVSIVAVRSAEDKRTPAWITKDCGNEYVNKAILIINANLAVAQTIKHNLTFCMWSA